MNKLLFSFEIERFPGSYRETLPSDFNLRRDGTEFNIRVTTDHVCGMWAVESEDQRSLASEILWKVGDAL